MIGIFILFGNYVALVTLLAQPAHAKAIRSVSVDSPMCRRHGNSILELIQGPHQMSVIGTDEKFDAFADRYIIQPDATLRSRDFWLFEEEAELEARLSARKVQDNDDSYNYRLCKSDPVMERRYNIYPFVKISWTCKKNSRIVKSFSDRLDFDCIPIQEERPILKLADFCLKFNSASEEQWIHSTETVNTGCQAILKLKS